MHSSTQTADATRPLQARHCDLNAESTLSGLVATDRPEGPPTHFDGRVYPSLRAAVWAKLFIDLGLSVEPGQHGPEHLVVGGRGHLLLHGWRPPRRSPYSLPTTYAKIVASNLRRALEVGRTDWVFWPALPAPDYCVPGYGTDARGRGMRKRVMDLEELLEAVYGLRNPAFRVALQQRSSVALLAD
jgi:hypothetical protein